MEQYLPAIVTGVIAGLGWAISYGTLRQSVRNNTEAIKDLDAEQDNQWKYIHDTREQVAKVKGRLGINGDSALPPVPQRRRAPAGGD
jgi:hypothetical protein